MQILLFVRVCGLIACIRVAKRHVLSIRIAMVTVMVQLRKCFYGARNSTRRGFYRVWKVDVYGTSARLVVTYYRHAET